MSSGSGVGEVTARYLAKQYTCPMELYTVINDAYPNARILESCLHPTKKYSKISEIISTSWVSSSSSSASIEITREVSEDV